MLALVLGNVSDVGERDAKGGGCVELDPVPVSVSVTLGLAVLSVAVMVSVRAPVVCGVKEKTRVQLALTARFVLAVQVLAAVCVKEVVAPLSA